MDNEEIDPEQFYASMKYLSNEKTREIIRILFDEPLTLSELVSKMKDISKPTLSRLLKEMENNKVVSSSEIKESRPGRKRKKYFPKIKLPKMSREELKDLLEKGYVAEEGTYADFQTEIRKLERYRVIDQYGNETQFNPTLYVSDLILCGLKVETAFRVLTEFSIFLHDKISAEEIVKKTMEILKRTDPIKADNYKKMVKKDLFIKSVGRRKWNPQEAVEIARNELGVNLAEANFLVSEFRRFLEVLGVYEFSYNYMITTLYLLAKKFKIKCRETSMEKIMLPEGSSIILTGRRINDLILKELGKTDQKISNEEIAEFKKQYRRMWPALVEATKRSGLILAPEDYLYYERVPILTRTNKVAKWQPKHIRNFLLQELGVSYDQATFIGNHAFERLQRLRLKRIPIYLVEEICKELLSEYNIREYKPPLRVSEDEIERLEISGDVSLLTHHRLGERILMKYVTEELARMHREKLLHIHAVRGWVRTPNHVQHDLRWFLSKGFPSGPRLPPPEDDVEVLNCVLRIVDSFGEEGILNQSFSSFNVFLCPYLQNLSDERIQKFMKLLILDLAARRNLTLTLNLDVNVPHDLSNLNVVKAERTMEETYGDYSELSTEIARICVETLYQNISVLLRENSPKIVLKFRENYSNYPDLIETTCTLMKEYQRPWRGIPRAPFLWIANLSDKYDNVSCNFTANGERICHSQWENYKALGDMQKITLDLLQIFRKKPSREDFIELLDTISRIARAGLIEKDRFLRKRFSEERFSILGEKMWGDSYVDVERSMYTIGLTSWAQMVNEILGRNPSVDIEAFDEGLQIINRIEEVVHQDPSEISIKIGQINHFSNSIQRFDKQRDFFFLDWLSKEISGDSMRKEEILQKKLEGGKTYYLKTPGKESEMRNIFESLLKSKIEFFTFLP